MKILLVLSFFLGCEPPAGGGPPSNALEVFKCSETMEFFREPESGLCFATCWGGSYHGGPGLANVPDAACESRVANKLSQKEKP